MEPLLLDFRNAKPLQVIVAAIVVFLTGLFVSRSWIARRSSSQTKLRLPPGPRGLPLLGSILSLGVRFPHKNLQKLSLQHGPLMFLHLGLRPVLVVCNSDMVKEVLQKHDQVFASRPKLSAPSIIYYDNLDIGFAPYGVYWRQIRKISNLQLLTASRLSRFMGTIESEIMATIQVALQESESSDGTGVNASNLFRGLTMNIVTLMMWRKRHCNVNSSTHGQMDEFEQVFRKNNELLKSNNIADFFPFLEFFVMKLSGWGKMAKGVHKEMDDFLEKIIGERENQLDKSTTTTATDDDDFLDVLLRLMERPDAGYERLSRPSVKAILMDLLTAGAETTSTTIEWALTEVLRKPDLMRRAQEELTRVVGNDRFVTRDDLPNLKFLAAVVRETLRRRSPAPVGLPRLSQADCKVGDFFVPANTMVIVNYWAVHHDPASWDKPMEFNPDRFLDSKVDFKGQHFQFVPFGSGRRHCPGLNLAATTLLFSVAQLLHTVNWTLPGGQAPESLDMSERPGVVVARRAPFYVIAKPRLTISHNIISSAHKG